MAKRKDNYVVYQADLWAVVLKRKDGSVWFAINRGTPALFHHRKDAKVFKDDLAAHGLKGSVRRVTAKIETDD